MPHQWCRCDSEALIEQITQLWKRRQGPVYPIKTHYLKVNPSTRTGLLFHLCSLAPRCTVESCLRLPCPPKASLWKKPHIYQCADECPRNKTLQPRFRVCRIPAMTATGELARAAPIPVTSSHAVPHNWHSYGPFPS